MRPGLAIYLENLTEHSVKTVITMRSGPSVKTSEVDLTGLERGTVSAPDV
jgi:hypothetical protein